MSKEAMKLALETSEGIVNADWRKWDELASPEEFERWVKSRANHMASVLREALANEALERMAENARELGLDYAPVWNNLPSNKDVEDAMRLKRLSRLAEQPAQQEPVDVDQATMELAESVGLIGPTSRTHDLHQAIQRFHDLICVNATVKAAQMAAGVIRESTPPQRTWVGLTDKEEVELWESTDSDWELMKRTESKLKEKNT